MLILPQRKKISWDLADKTGLYIYIFQNSIIFNKDLNYRLAWKFLVFCISEQEIFINVLLALFLQYFSDLL